LPIRNNESLEFLTGSLLSIIHAQYQRFQLVQLFLHLLEGLILFLDDLLLLLHRLHYRRNKVSITKRQGAGFVSADTEDVILCPDQVLYLLRDEPEVCPVVACFILNSTGLRVLMKSSPRLIS